MLDKISAGRTDLVIEWVERGGSPAASFEGQDLIGFCAYYGDASAVRYLHGRGVDLAQLGTDLGLTNAAFHGHWQLCEYLIEQGGDPNWMHPQTGETPLHAAICKAQSPAHERVVAVLIAAGADVNAATIPGMPTDNFMRDVRTRGETPLHRAGAFGTLCAIERLLQAGAGIDTKDANGDTPLTWASWALRDAAVLRLLCFPPHWIQPDHRPMAENLLGDPRQA